MKKNKTRVALEKQQVKKLEDMLVKGRWTKREIERAKILLEAHSQDKLNKSGIARKVGCGIEKVRRVIRRFLARNNLADALSENPRSGHPEKLTGEEKMFVVATACTKPPDGAGHWSLELLGLQVKKTYKKKVGKNCISKILHDNNLKPWKKKDVVSAKSRQRIRRENAGRIGSL